jgi:hypothetical protein
MHTVHNPGVIYNSDIRMTKLPMIHLSTKPNIWAIIINNT